MVVIASRQPGLRPETIRTRLARFMPSRAATGWSVAWSAGTEHAAEISGEHELRAAEHLGCYGSAVAHALAQAELAAERLRLSAESTGSSTPNGMPTITIEVRAQISGPAVDQAVFEAIIQRAEPSCPVLKGLATEAEIRLVAILDDSLSAGASMQQAAAGQLPTAQRPASNPNGAATSTDQAAAGTNKQEMPYKASSTPGGKAEVKPASTTSAASHGARSGMAASGMNMPSVARGMAMARQCAPKWLTGRMAVLLVIAFGACAAAPAMWGVLG